MIGICDNKRIVIAPHKVDLDPMSNSNIGSIPLAAGVSLLKKAKGEGVPNKDLSKSKRNRVSFDEEKSQTNKNEARPSVEELTLKDIRRSWYSKPEIALFKIHAKLLMLHRHQITEDMSGFERFNSSRIREKKSALHYVVLSQLVKKDPEFQRHVSQNCTARAKVLALNQGLENFRAAYDPLSCLVGSSSGGENYTNVLFKKEAIPLSTNDAPKRPIAEVSDDDETCSKETDNATTSCTTRRRVRQRGATFVQKEL